MEKEKKELPDWLWILIVLAVIVTLPFWLVVGSYFLIGSMLWCFFKVAYNVFIKKE